MVHYFYTLLLTKPHPLKMSDAVDLFVLIIFGGVDGENKQFFS